MEGGQRYEGADRARVRMVAQPASVPAARHFVDTTLLGWGREGLIDDVGLCVTELSTNATLHSGSQYFEIELQRRTGSLRVAVLDKGTGNVDVLAAKSEYAEAVVHEEATEHTATTGRGMFIVSALATSWGIDELAEGKRVWAEFAQDHDTYDTEPPVVSHVQDPGTPGTSAPSETAEWAVVRFVDCPAALLLAHDDNLADTIRELQLIGSDLQQPRFRRLGELLAGHVQRHSVNWDAARIQALEAVRAGREFTDIQVLAPRDVMRDVRFLRSLVGEAEALSRAGQLMTLPSASDIQDLRDWLEAEFRAQTEAGRGPVSYLTWLASRPTVGD